MCFTKINTGRSVPSDHFRLPPIKTERLREQRVERGGTTGSEEKKRKTKKRKKNNVSFIFTRRDLRTIKLLCFELNNMEPLLLGALH